MANHWQATVALVVAVFAWGPGSAAFAADPPWEIESPENTDSDGEADAESEVSDGREIGTEAETTRKVGIEAKIAEEPKSEYEEIRQRADWVRDYFEEIEKRLHDERERLIPIQHEAEEHHESAQRRLEAMDRAIDAADGEITDDLRDAVDEADEAVTAFGNRVGKSANTRQLYEAIARAGLLLLGAVIIFVVIAWRTWVWWKRREERWDPERIGLEKEEMKMETNDE